MGRCRGPVNRLLMMRKRGLCGPAFQNVGGGVCAKSAGAYYDVNGPGSGFSHELTIGDNVDGDYGYVYQSFGAMVPDTTRQGVLIHTFTSGGGDLSIVAFGEDGDLQPENLAPVIVFNVGDFGEITVTWSETNSQYEGINLGFTAYLQDNIGNTIDVEIVAQ